MADRVRVAAENKRLRSRIATLKDALRRVEWVVMLEHYIQPEWNEEYCPECYREWAAGHIDGCALHVALEEAEQWLSGIEQ